MFSIIRSLAAWLFGHDLAEQRAAAFMRSELDKARAEWAPREPQFIGGRYDGMTEHEACQLVHRYWMEDGRCWLELFDPLTGVGHVYENYGDDWWWAGRVRERV